MSGKEEKKQKVSDKASNMPKIEEFICPITSEYFKDPVIASDEFTYEREAIEKWLEESSLSPMTLEPLPSKALIPNWTLKKAIAEYREKVRPYMKKNETLLKDATSKIKKMTLEIEETTLNLKKTRDELHRTIALLEELDVPRRYHKRRRHQHYFFNRSDAQKHRLDEPRQRIHRRFY